MDAFDGREMLMSLIPMLLYAVGVMAVLIVAGNDDLAPYPFLEIHSQPVWMTALWIAALTVMAFVISKMYVVLGRRFNPHMAG